MKEYAHILHALADGKEIQYQDIGGIWSKTESMRGALNCIINGVPPHRLRIKPDTININGHEVPAPLREAPAVGSPYWMVNFDHDGCNTSYIWENDGIDRKRLSHGILHATKDAAEANARALLSFMEQKP